MYRDVLQNLKVNSCIVATVTNFSRSKRFVQNFSWQSCTAISYKSTLLYFLIKMIKYTTGLKYVNTKLNDLTK